MPRQYKQIHFVLGQIYYMYYVLSIYICIMCYVLDVMYNERRSSVINSAFCGSIVFLIFVKFNAGISISNINPRFSDICQVQRRHLNI